MKPGTLMKCTIVLSLCGAAQAGADEAPKAAFLKLIDRPRVALAPAAETATVDGLVQSKFSFASETGERVPGILERQAGDARRPVMVALHPPPDRDMVHGEVPLGHDLL